MAISPVLFPICRSALTISEVLDPIYPVPQALSSDDIAPDRQKIGILGVNLR